MSVILGINAGGHDGSVAVVKDGKLISALSRERVTRIKRDGNGNIKPVILALLDSVNLCVDDIDFVAFNDVFFVLNEFSVFDSNIRFSGSNFVEIFDDGIKVNNEDFKMWLMKDSYKKFTARIGNREVPAFQVHHHLSHCAYAFYTSNFERSACLSLDSTSDIDWTSSVTALGDGTKVDKLYCPKLQVGNFYLFFTHKLGLGDGINKAGTLMGLASYGTPLQEVVDDWRRFADYDYGFNKRAEHLHYENYWYILSKKTPNNWNEAFFPKDSKKAMDIAASVQYVFEKAIMDAVNVLYEKTKDFNDGNICLSGGSFLNCNVNTLIKNNSKFKRVSVSPACGDEGISAGNALYVAHNILGKSREKYSPKDLIYLGGSYNIPDIGESYSVFKVARLIKDGKIVAWYQGRSEFGPRALGNRSLLADPTNPDMKNILNSRIKHREWFRPFAPSVLVEKSEDWFDFEGPSPFMLFTSKVRHPKLIPAVTHVDDTARMQTVDKKDNPKYYELIEEFEKISGVPMILNTSLNVNGEPIVETPEDAIRFLKSTDCDALVLGDRLIFKDDVS